MNRHWASHISFRIPVCALVLLLLAGCAAPIGARRVSTRVAYEQIEANALHNGKPSAMTVAILHRYGLDDVARRQPDAAVRQLHAKALSTGERDLLFALAELSYAAGDRLRHNVKPWDAPDPRDYYLASALYSWLFLFGEARDPAPSAFDRRFRDACDLYNYSLGLAFTKPKDTNGVVQFQESTRRLPVGEIDIRLSSSNFAPRLEEFDRILLADQYRVRGLSVRNRAGGVGATLVCVRPADAHSGGIRLSTPATVLLRGPASLAELDSGRGGASLELYSSFDVPTVSIAGAQVPLETDLTTFRAYTLNQSSVWKLGMAQFLSAEETVRTDIYLTQPYSPGRIPVVFVHGTFSSPIWWAEMLNTLVADPELRQRYQFWYFIYNSGNPMMYSATRLRAALETKLKEIDPQNQDPALRQMVVIGHSQGGLLTKLTATDTGDKVLAAVLKTNRAGNLKISPGDLQLLRQYTCYEPLPFVKRVVFISTPHRGSYVAGSFARNLARKLVRLPSSLAGLASQVSGLTEKLDLPRELRGTRTSLDSMSPRNPALLALAEIPPADGVKANSIIAVQGNGDFHEGKDGLVSYRSAHVDYAESEFIVRSFHSCQDKAPTIEEVRRILHKHLETVPGAAIAAKDK